jgi:hypothetical protein
MEKGYGLVTVMYHINEYHEEQGLDEVGMSTAR